MATPIRRLSDDGQRFLGRIVPMSAGLTLFLLLSGCQVRRTDPAPPPIQSGAPHSQAPLPAPSAVTPPADQPPLKAKRIYHAAALGDSITDERVGGGGYLEYLREACPRSTFHHFGKGGDMTNQMRRRLLNDLLPMRAQLELDTLIVLGGVNDLYSNVSAHRTNERIEEDLGAIYEAARNAGLRVVAITVLPWGGFRRYFSPERSDNTRALNSFILGLAGDGRVDVAVDGYALLSCGEPENLCPAFERTRPDGLHPGREGHRTLGAALHQRAFADCL